MDSWWQASREICQSDRCEQTEGGRAEGGTDRQTEGPTGRKERGEENVGGRQRLMPRRGRGKTRGGRCAGNDARAVSCCNNDTTNGAGKITTTNSQKVNTTIAIRMSFLCLANQQDLLGDRWIRKPVAVAQSVGPSPSIIILVKARARALFPHITRVCPNTEET